MGIEIIPAAFMDHYAVALHITVNGTHLKRARGRWKMEPLLITDEHLKRRISSEWMKWRNQRQNYLDITMWWERYVKKTPPDTHPQRTG